MHKTGLRIIYGSSRTKIFLYLQLKIIGYFNGCAKAKSHPYHPQVKLITFVSSSYLFGPCAQSNGLDKRFNQTLQRMLVKPMTGQKELCSDELIDSAVFAYSTSCHESSCYAPFEVMFGHKAVCQLMWI